MEKFTVDDVFAYAYKHQEEYPTCRFGQALMVSLYKFNFDMYKKITGTESDPFYLTNRVDAFVETLQTLIDNTTWKQ